MTHTPGPWKVKTTSRHGELGVRAGGGYICILSMPYHYSGQDERYAEEMDEYSANARLIAAAPQLLEALRFLLQPLTLGAGDGMKALDHLHQSIEMAQAAIAAAEGDTP